MANSNGWGDGAANNTVGWGQGANNTIGWGSSHATSWAGATDIVGLTTDPSASAFITATGITGATQQSAVDALVKGLKADGLWSKMKAVYPFVTDNRNLASYTEDFSNAYWLKTTGTVVTSNDILAPDGTMTADKVVFSGTNKEIYATVGGAGTYKVSVYIKGTSGQTIAFGDGVGVAGQLFTLDGSWQRIDFTTTASSFQFDVNTFLGATARTIWLWGAQVETGSTLTTYQPIATTQQAYIASQFKYNLVNPVDSDAAFRLVFNGGWTHSSNGATPNGTNGYADTYVKNNINLTDRASHWSMYFRTLVNDGFNGYYNGASAVFGVQPKDNTTKVGVGLNNLVVTGVTSALGYYVGSVNSAVSAKLYVNNSNVYNTITNTSLSALNLNFYIGALNNNLTPIIYSSNQCSFTTLGDKLTDTEASNLYSRVNTFQVALSRNV